MKAVQLARAGLQLLWCCCQILAGPANMNLQLSDSALIVWLKGGIWVEWLARTLALQSQCSGCLFVRHWVDLDPAVVRNVVSGTAMWLFFLMAQYHSSLTESNDTVEILLLKCLGQSQKCCFLNLIRAITPYDEYLVLILNCVPSWTLRSQTCCHGAELPLSQPAFDQCEITP